LQGWRDIALNATGIQQAQVLAQALQAMAFSRPIDTVYSSDLCRASETARIATAHLGLPIQTDAGLRERGFGTFEGSDWEALKHNGSTPGAFNIRDPDTLIENGETLRVFQQRIVDTFQALAQRLPGNNVMVFSHGGVIDAVWRKLSNMALEAPRPFDILNTSINRFSINSQNEWSLGEWGIVSHLTQDA